jgi:hypothetical protein
VKLLKTSPQLTPDVEYPRVVASVGEAPPQYPNWEDEDEEGDDDEEWEIEIVEGQVIKLEGDLGDEAEEEEAEEEDEEEKR